MFRSVLTIILVAALLWIGRSLMLRLQHRGNSRSGEKSQPGRDMVQCQHCKAYILKDDALTQGERSFCNQQHLDAWKQSN